MTKNTSNDSLHKFHIPVMGTGFTIDTPLSVAKYGITSVLSLADDTLIEQVRKYCSEKFGEIYKAIPASAEDSRAQRITAYLNLLQKLVAKQLAKLKESLFTAHSEITKYFAMLPNGGLRQKYQQMLAEQDVAKKAKQQEDLRQAVVAGGIDVNIMTKLDRVNYRDGEALPYEFCDAAAALRGFANSDLKSSVVFSAGFNPHLYGYLTKFDDFFPDQNLELKKKICLKVSDYRSAAVQGKYLAKHGLWVSEYRIESPLNCGGHAFVNDGQLLGPILEEFKVRRDELIATLHAFYKNALQSMRKICSNEPQTVRITAQGGIGTNDEHEFLLKRYNLDATGWGTPFLLVPEATNVDELHLQKLIKADVSDVFLSSSSPLGVPFWNLFNSASEEARRERIKNGIPGSICTKGFAKLDREFTARPICRASREYQKQKLLQLEQSNLPPETLQTLKDEVLSKSCICNDLAGGATIKKGIDPKATTAICPGPNLINFKKIATLKEMVDHIYGRYSLFINDARPHMFIRELQLQLDYLFAEIKNASLGLPARSQQKLAEVKQNLSQGIEYYKGLAKELVKKHQENFLKMLQDLQAVLEEGSSAANN